MVLNTVFVTLFYSSGNPILLWFGFLSDFSDKFYNIQLDISKSGIMEKGFKQINWILAQ